MAAPLSVTDAVIPVSGTSPTATATSSAGLRPVTVWFHDSVLVMLATAPAGDGPAPPTVTAAGGGCDDGLVCAGGWLAGELRGRVAGTLADTLAAAGVA